MPDSSLMIGLFSLAGTALGFTGGLITSLVVERQRHANQLTLESQKHEREKRKKKAEKLEELVSELYAHEHWVAALSNNVELGKDDIITALGRLPPPPISKMLAISNIYFPGLQEPIQAFSKLAATHVKSIVHKGQLNFDRSNDLFRQHNEAVKHLEKLIRDYARREFQ